MERALEAKEFVPYYQPLVDLRSGAIVGAEVLMRWRKPDGSVVPPAAFIPLAESSGLILDMTLALMRAARDEFGQVLGLRPRVKIGFNLTARHFANETIVAEVREIFAGIADPHVADRARGHRARAARGSRHGAARHRGAAGARLQGRDRRCRHRPWRPVLHAQARRRTIIKIDKMFVDAIGTERYSTTIIETLIDLARSMRMEILAEGVETFDQVKYLRERGIFLAQGYAFAPPLPGPLFRQLLEAAHPLGTGGGGRTQHPSGGRRVHGRARPGGRGLTC